jgi:hypothetical protein
MNKFDIVWNKISNFGPDRVMIDEYEGVSYSRAREEYGISPDIIFIRHDGWSLGAPNFLEKAAYRMWKNEWIGFVKRPSEIIEKIEDYE